MVMSLQPMIDPNHPTEHRGVVFTPSNNWISVDNFKTPFFVNAQEGFFPRGDNPPANENSIGVIISGYSCHKK